MAGVILGPTKKKLKNLEWGINIMEKNKAKRILDGIAAVSASVAIAGTVYASAGLYNIGDAEQKYNDILDKASQSESYKNDVLSREKELVRQMEAGEITYSQFETKMQALRASEYVEQFVTADDASALNYAKNQHDFADDVTTTGMSAAVLGVFAYVGSKFANTNYDAISRRIHNLKKKKEEQDLDNVL